LYPFIRGVVKQTAVFIEAYLFYQLHTKFYPIFCCLGLVHMQRKLMGIISLDFEITGQLLIVFCTCQIPEKEWEYSEAVHQLFIDFK
jgi:hypothetical protein